MSYVSEALEQELEAAKHLDSLLRGKQRRHGAQPGERKMWETDLIVLRKARVFYWGAGPTEAVASALPSFKLDEIECRRHVLPTDFGFCWFGERPPFTIEEFRTHRVLDVKAISWFWGWSRTPSEHFLGATVWCHSAVMLRGGKEIAYGPVSPFLWICVPAGERMTVAYGPTEFQGVEDETTHSEMEKLKQFVLAAGAFLRQELLVETKTGLERHARKRLAKALPGVPPPSIYVVHLRKVLRNEAEAASPVGPSRKYDNVRWWVGLHTRQQWYPSLQEHLPVLISPYIKGPKGKPLKPRTEPIFAVVR